MSIKKKNTDAALLPYLEYYKDGFNLEWEDDGKRVVVPASINFLGEMFKSKKVESGNVNSTFYFFIDTINRLPWK